MSHIIGIDLGTTNSTMAFSSSEKVEIQQFEIEQRITTNLSGKKSYLPSFYFFSLEDAIPTIGWYAKERGAELPDRVIASAKSWLCHDLIDRRSLFLPLGNCEKKQSPIEVCASFLRHMRSCWEKTFHESLFTDQNILVTVPASFDPGARSLVIEASKLAGYPDIRLIEEPLAAFYAWLYQHQSDWRNYLKMHDTVLVVDIGGGTTDFSLIAVEDKGGELGLERKAVGNHLLLGGDNIDLSLAYLAKEKFPFELDEWQFQSLIHACRQAKESLLGIAAPEQVEITIQGRSSRLIGNTLTAVLKKDEVEKMLLEGFFPRVDLSEPILTEKRSGIAKMGLPFARDPRVTAQLAHFFSNIEAPLPSAVLFNGGTMKSVGFQNRVLDVLSYWKKGEVKSLDGADFDFGVSKGAVYYGWARANHGIRVKAATCCSYYIGVEGALPTIPGVAVPLTKIQIVPFGMEEGSEQTLNNQQFALYLEEPALFKFFSQNSSASSELVELHPIETMLHAQGEEGKMVLVKLTARLTELGMLELWCVAEDGRRWKLEFNIRTN